MLWVNSAANNAPGSGVALCHLERDGLRYLVPLSDEINPLFGFAFLESFLDTLKEYLGDVTEVTVKDNFDVVYMVSVGANEGCTCLPAKWSESLQRDFARPCFAGNPPIVTDRSSSRRCLTRATHKRWRRQC